MSEQNIDWGNCILCGQYILSADDVAQGGWFDERGRRRQCHRECALRNVVGGIGHLIDHAYWCGQMGDPDGGKSYRQSAIEVDWWIRKHGFPQTV